MRAKLLPSMITTAAVSCLGGCYPTFLTSRPEAQIIVTRESGAPLEAPEGIDLTRYFYSEPDEGACFFDTKYTMRSWVDQPPAAFGPLTIVVGKR
jgi:hypothetical protein